MVVVNDFTPKKPTQQSNFLQNYPEYDGRGIKIAIIDSGVDVSLPGLQKTSTGLPKIIDCIGFSRVDTSTIKKADKNSTLIGLTGKKLTIPAKWKNPSGNWHLGKKLYSELLPEALQQNFTEENKEKQRGKKKHELYLDCIVWFDGAKWRACLDTSFSGDLENVKVLSSYSNKHEYGILSEKFVYSVTIQDNAGHQDNGNSLTIETTKCEHGTAHLAAAFFPGEPHKDGMAPGAQIISMNLENVNILKPFHNAFFSLKMFTKSKNDFDKHFGGKYLEEIWEQSTALIKCIEMKVDIVILSITIPKDLSKIVKQMVEIHGIIIVKAAGNNGPIHLSLDNNEAGYNLP